MQATLGLSGRAGTTALRGNVDAGFDTPDRVRLEGRPPIGRPVFILVAGSGRSTLYMPRDNRVLRDVAPESIVEALVGVALTPGELRSIVSGCGFGVGEPSQGREYTGVRRGRRRRHDDVSAARAERLARCRRDAGRR